MNNQVDKLSGAKRSRSMFAALFVVVVFLYLVCRYGPKPDFQITGDETRGSDRIQTQMRKPDGDPLSPLDVVLGSLGAERTLVGEGCDSREAALFFDNLETEQRRQGLQPLQPGENNLPHRYGLRGKGLFWRNRLEGVEVLGTVTQNPIQHVHVLKSELTVTLGSTSLKCGTHWVTYRYAPPAANAPRSLKAVAVSDADDADFPRPPDTQQLIRMAGPYGGEVRAYSSNANANELKSWYRTHMANAWQSLDIDATPEYGAIKGAMYFTRSDRYCLIWISSNGTHRATILISSGRNELQGEVF